MDPDKKGYTLYKIYSENCLLYLGRTKQPLKDRLRGHFFKAPMVREINIDSVVRIEYASFPTEADMNVYEIYLINKFKPVLNRDDKAKDQLTFELPEIEFREYKCPLMDKWRQEVHVRDAQDKQMRNLHSQLEMEKHEKHNEIYSREDLTLEEKQEQWWSWLEKYYEPARNGIF